MKGRIVGVALLATIFMGMSGCVVVPALKPDKSTETAYSADPSLPNAIKVAESLRSNYTKEVKDQIITERVTALAPTAAPAVAADMAIRDVSKNEILGLTVGSGAVYTATNFMVGK